MDFKLKSMFYKDIDRDIKGVIKVGQNDDANIRQELDEYVVTGELNTYIDRFFEAYKAGIIGDTDKNGVWISGFFGSGKSHFLKILSYLLENRSIDGKNSIDVVLPIEISSKIDGEELFNYSYELSRNFRFSYKNNCIHIILDKIKLDKHYLIYLITILIKICNMINKK